MVFKTAFKQAKMSTAMQLAFDKAHGVSASASVNPDTGEVTALVIAGEDGLSEAEQAMTGVRERTEHMGRVDEPRLGAAYIDPKVTLRDEKAERQQTAIDNRDAAGEAAAIVSSTLAPQNESAHQERENSVRTCLMLIADEFGGDAEYIGQAVIEAVCNRFDYLVAAKNKQIEQAISELLTLRRRFKGDEVTDNRIITKLEWIEKCEAQRDGAKDVLRASCDAYKNLTGDVWYPRHSDPLAQAGKAKTAAAAAADEKLKAYGVEGGKMPAKAPAGAMRDLKQEPQRLPNEEPPMVDERGQPVA